MENRSDRKPDRRGLETSLPVVVKMSRLHTSNTVSKVGAVARDNDGRKMTTINRKMGRRSF